MSVINVKKHTTLEVETPQLNRTNIYIKTDNSLAWKDDTGTEHVAATGISPEEVQDIIGSTMVDSATVNFTYNDAGNQIYADVIQSGIDHGSISGLGDDDHIQYLNNTRGDARYYTQTQLNAGQLNSLYYTETEINAFLAAKANLTSIGAANGIAGLDAAQKILLTNIPNGIDHTTLNNIGTNTHAQIDSHIASTSNPHGVTKAQIGLGNCDNTSDLNKPISTATQTALNNKENLINAGTITQYWRGDKSFQTLDKVAVGLGNVDNTSDLTKPISNLTQTALNAKENTIAAGTVSQYWRGDKTWQTLDKTSVGLPNVPNTDATLRSNHTGTQLAVTISDFANAVRSTVLTGLSLATDAAILATDSILTALGKIQAQINGHFGQGGSAHALATSSVNGFMSALDKVKLDGLTNDVVLKTTAQLDNSSSTTFTTVNQHAINVVAGRTYVFEMLLRYQTAATTTGIVLSIGGTATGQLAANANAIVASGTAGLFSGPLTALNGVLTTTGVVAANTPYIARTTGIFVATTSGLIYPQFRSEVNGSQVSVLASSVTTFKELV